MRTAFPTRHSNFDDLFRPAPLGEYSLYIHLPFCERKCPYCNFFVLLADGQKEKELCSALLSEWKQWTHEVKGLKLRSIYFGGGTPSLFPVEYFEKIIDAIDPPSSAEITVEVNPEHASFTLFSQFAQLGVNRISLGAQSLSQSALKLLGRKHTSIAIEQGIEAAQAAGLSNISLDLMYELPDQSCQNWRETLRRVRDWPIQHLSLYNLTIESNTPFHQKRKMLAKRLPSSNSCLDMFLALDEEMPSFGWDRYEISALARPGFASIHNAGYWRGRNFIGLGPSAHSFWNHRRFANTTNWKHYLASAQTDLAAMQIEDALSWQDRLKELFLIHLRLTEGIDLQSFGKRWGKNPFPMSRLLTHVQRENLKFQKGIISLTSLGMRYYDAIASDLI